MTLTSVAGWAYMSCQCSDSGDWPESLSPQDTDVLQELSSVTPLGYFGQRSWWKEAPFLRSHHSPGDQFCVTDEYLGLNVPNMLRSGKSLIEAVIETGF
ncbi:hypothetical protein E4U61_006276 [Claviceps capensis]|nr:hypothetical protein E4U61_006276 [Claviceps capensis]